MNQEPWYDRELTKNQIPVVVSIFAIVIGTIIGFTVKLDRDMELRHENNRKACQELDIYFGQSVTVKEGFYKGVPMTAVGMGQETVQVQYMKGLQLENSTFLCGDLEKK